MPVSLNSIDYEYSDVINRIGSEYTNERHGTPPGNVVEGVLRAQNSPAAMSSGAGTPEGIANVAMDSNDVAYFVQRYGREPNLFSPEDAVYVVTEGVSQRRQMGGYFGSWPNAAEGITGAVSPDGYFKDATADEKKKHGNWVSEFRRGAFQAKYKDAWLKEAVNETPVKEGDVVGYFKDGEYKIEPYSSSNADHIGHDVPNWEDMPEFIKDEVKENFALPIINAIKEWAPRIMLFLVGAVLLGFGVYHVFRG